MANAPKWVGIDLQGKGSAWGYQAMGAIYDHTSGKFLFRVPPEYRPLIVEAVNNYDSMKAEIAELRVALHRVHNCATLRDDGTCDGCFVSAALAKEGE
jgi:hypothetical protein